MRDSRGLFSICAFVLVVAGATEASAQPLPGSPLSAPSVPYLSTATLGGFFLRIDGTNAMTATLHAAPTLGTCPTTLAQDFNGDADTGVAYIAANQWELCANGVDLLDLLSARTQLNSPNGIGSAAILTNTQAKLSVAVASIEQAALTVTTTGMNAFDATGVQIGLTGGAFTLKDSSSVTIDSFTTTNASLIATNGLAVAKNDGVDINTGIGVSAGAAGTRRLIVQGTTAEGPFQANDVRTGSARSSSEVLYHVDTTDADGQQVNFLADETGAGAVSGVTFGSINLVEGTHDHATKASSLLFRTFLAGAEVTPLTLNGSLITMANNITITASNNKSGSTTANVWESNVVNTGGADTAWRVNCSNLADSSDNCFSVFGQFQFRKGGSVLWGEVAASAAPGSAGNDVMWADSTDHRWEAKVNNGNQFAFVLGSAKAPSNAGSGTCATIGTVSGTDLATNIGATTCIAGQTVILTLGGTYASAPACVASSAMSVSTTTTTATLKALIALTAEPVTVMCHL